MKTKERIHRMDRICLSEHLEFIDDIVSNYPFLRRKAKKAVAKMHVLLDGVMHMDYGEWNRQYEEYLVIMTSLLVDSLNTDIGHPS